MAGIIATGKWNGKKTKVEIKDGKTYIDDFENDSMDLLIYEQYPIGGTFYAEPNSIENALNTLTYHFFDEKPKIETTGTFEEMPSVEGRIY